MGKVIAINIFGGPGAGKSTTAAGVFSLLKLHGVNVELINEYAKDLTWENRHKTLENQEYILAKQYHKQWRLDGVVDVIITDSPLLLNLIYAPPNQSSTFKDYVRMLNDRFNNVNYILNRTKEYTTVGRNQTLDQAKTLDVEIKNSLSKEMYYKEVPGSYVGINMITNDILKLLGIDVTHTFNKLVS